MRGHCKGGDKIVAMAGFVCGCWGLAISASNFANIGHFWIAFVMWRVSDRCSGRCSKWGERYFHVLLWPCDIGECKGTSFECGFGISVRQVIIWAINHFGIIRVQQCDFILDGVFFLKIVANIGTLFHIWANFGAGFGQVEYVNEVCRLRCR